jgi:hypothetical protein
MPRSHKAIDTGRRNEARREGAEVIGLIAAMRASLAGPETTARRPAQRVAAAAAPRAGARRRNAKS